MPEETEPAVDQANLWPTGEAGLAQTESEDRIIKWLQRILGTGRRLDESTRRRAESLFRRNLGDVRLHDSRMSAELARRLGAEAFTVKSHIFGPREELEANKTEVSGLLAHEIAHVVQQTEPQALDGDERPATPYSASMPLLDQGGRLSAGVAAKHDDDWPRPPANIGSRSPALTNRVVPATPHVQLRARGRTLMRAADSQDEIEAQAAEQMVSRASDANSRSTARSVVQPEIIADKVYRLMLSASIVERERSGRRS